MTHVGAFTLQAKADVEAARASEGHNQAVAGDDAVAMNRQALDCEAHLDPEPECRRECEPAEARPIRQEEPDV